MFKTWNRIKNFKVFSDEWAALTLHYSLLILFYHAVHLQDIPGNPTGWGLTPKVKEIAPSGFLQNVRLVKVTLPPQEENLGQPRF